VQGGRMGGLHGRYRMGRDQAGHSRRAWPHGRSDRGSLACAGGLLAVAQSPALIRLRSRHMIDHATLITYILIVLGFVFIPGPATLLTMARAASSGTRVGIATGAGIAAGDIVHTTMAIVGLSAVIATSALLFSIIKYAGAAFL